MLIYGIHACQNAIRMKKHDIKIIFVQKDKPIPSWISDFPKSKVTYLSSIELKNMLPKNAVFQGIAIEIDDVKYADITDLISAPKNCVIAILDNVTDPHNFGAIIRTAAAFGIKGIVVTEKSSCKITGTVVKTASGGIEYVSIYVVKNLSQTIKTLKEYGFWIVSFCERGDKFINEVDLKGKTALVLGAEGDGIRRLQKEQSDFIVKLPTKPFFPTLNVSVSAGIAFFEAARQNNFNL